MYSTIQILTEMYCAHQYLSIDPKNRQYLSIDPKQRPQTAQHVAPTIFILEKFFYFFLVFNTYRLTQKKAFLSIGPKKVCHAHLMPTNRPSLWHPQFSPTNRKTLWRYSFDARINISTEIYLINTYRLTKNKVSHAHSNAYKPTKPRPPNAHKPPKTVTRTDLVTTVTNWFIKNFNWNVLG